MVWGSDSLRVEKRFFNSKKSTCKTTLDRIWELCTFQKTVTFFSKKNYDYLCVWLASVWSRNTLRMYRALWITAHFTFWPAMRFLACNEVSDLHWGFWPAMVFLVRAVHSWYNSTNMASLKNDLQVWYNQGARLECIGISTWYQLHSKTVQVATKTTSVELVTNSFVCSLFI